MAPDFFFAPRHPGKLMWGIGPAFAIPTATDHVLGQGKFSMGPSAVVLVQPGKWTIDRKSTRLNSSHTVISYAVFCLKKKEHTSELQSHSDPVSGLLLEKKIFIITRNSVEERVSCWVVSGMRFARVADGLLEARSHDGALVSPVCSR